VFVVMLRRPTFNALLALTSLMMSVMAADNGSELRKHFASGSLRGTQQRFIEGNSTLKRIAHSRCHSNPSRSRHRNTQSIIQRQPQ
jgi:hypothetical protein